MTTSTTPEAPAAPPPAPVSVPLRRTPPVRSLWSAAVFLLLGVFPAVLLPVGWFWWARVVSDVAALALLVAFGLGAIAWLSWMFALPKPGPIVVADGFVELPWGRSRLRMALHEVLLCRLDDKALNLFAATAPGATGAGDVGAVVIQRRYFVDADGALDVVAAIRAAMAAMHPGLVERLDANEARQRAFFQRRPVVIYTAAAVCVAGFAAELAVGAIGDGVVGASALIRMGANSSLRVGELELWRLVTANFLHGSLIHIGMNLAALLSTGAVVERWLGRPATVAVLVVSGVVGQATSVLLALSAGEPRVSVGISGAIFGVLGVLLVSSVRYRKQGAGGIRVPASTWVVLLLTNAAISTIPMVDAAAHGGGLVAGAAVALVVSPRPQKKSILAAKHIAMAGIAGIIVVIVSASFLATSLIFGP